jgi:rod shape-determining protein MreD
VAESEAGGYWVILASFLCALVLAVMPLPHWLLWGRPEWVVLVLIYWCIALPHRVGLITALVLGISLDVLEGAVLGQNAFGLCVVALGSLALYRRLRVFNPWQQSAVVFALAGIHLVLCQWVANLEGLAGNSHLFLLPAVSSALLWPLVFQLLRTLRRSYRVT